MKNFEFNKIMIENVEGAIVDICNNKSGQIVDISDILVEKHIKGLIECIKKDLKEYVKECKKISLNKGDIK